MPTHDDIHERDHTEALRDHADHVAAVHLNSLVPVQVRVARHALDPDWMRDQPHIIDEGRTGWMRRPVGEGDTLFLVPGWAFVTELSPPEGIGDGNPTRWLNPRNLLPVRTPSPIVGDWSPDR